MAVQKEYSRGKKSCKITFTIEKSLGKKFKTISLVGDFNGWDPNANHFTENRSNGDYTTSIVLPAGKEYQFRYLGDGIHWFNENDADKEVETYFEGAKNSVVIV